MLIILSPSFLESPSCDFQSKFAHSISPGKYGNGTRFSKFRIIVSHSCDFQSKFAHSISPGKYHTGQCKRTGGCYKELVVAFLCTGGGLKGKRIYTC